MRFWQRILLQQSQDAVSNINSGTANARKNQARAFLTGYHPDFINACLLAGWNPDWLRMKCKVHFANLALLIPPARIRKTTIKQPYFDEWNKLCKQKLSNKRNIIKSTTGLICTLNQCQMTTIKQTKKQQLQKTQQLQNQEVLPLF